jgi:hypothetical protein
MPSPFPGMDPYLEAPHRWADVHHELISGIRERLNDQLRPKYYTRLEERIYLSDDLDTGRAVIVPDVLIHPNLGNPSRSADSVETATLQITEPIILDDLFEEEIHEPYITIIDRAGRSIVAVIEVLSPSNKVAHSSGRASFQAKRREVFDSTAHWVEIDLLRAGELGLGVRAGLPPHEYAVFVSKAGDKRRHGLIWTIRLNQRLPTFSIPLLGNDPDATLDLQEVLTTAYDRAAYDADVDYAVEPIPALDSEFRSWADRLLREKGVR